MGITDSALEHLTFIMKLLLVAALIQGSLGVWVDICKDGFSSENECCKLSVGTTDATSGVTTVTQDLGMQGHEYELVYTKSTYSDQSVECRLKSIDDSTRGYHLATFESRKEYNCVMKYLVEEHGDFGPFYIGLKADAGDSKKNLFEWDKPMVGSVGIADWTDIETLDFTSWAPSSPAGAGDCVQVTASQVVTSGLWIDRKCTESLPTICERYPKEITTTPKPDSTLPF